jgi:hypothetical protein
MNRRRPATTALLLGLSLTATLALLPAASAAPPAADAAARRVLDRYLEATGGRAAWASDTTAHIFATVSAFGLHGTTEMWLGRPDRSVATTHMGPMTILQGTIGGRAWRVDQNGKLQWLDGPEREEAQSQAYFDQDVWLAPDLGGGRGRLIGPAKEDSASYDVVEITPPAGKPRRLYFDQATGLLSKAVQTADTQTIEAHFSGYGPLAGRVRARDALARVLGAPANDVHTHVDSARVGEAVDSTAFLPPLPPARDFRFLDGGSVATVPMRYSVRHVWVKASVNGGPPVDFVLDTGASVTVLDSTFAAGAGLASAGQISAVGAGASGNMRFGRLESVTIAGEAAGGVEVTKQNVVIAPLNRFLASAFWRDVAGVLGYDFISRFVTTVDYAGQKLVLHDPDGFTYSGSGAALSISLAGGVPVVHAKLDDLYEGEFRLDVGSGSSVDLHTPFVQEHGLEAQAATKVSDPGGGFGGTFERLATRMKSFTIGPYTVADPLIDLNRATVGAMASKDYAGNVGNRILDRFSCTLDYGRKMLYLEPNSQLARRDEFSRFGAQLRKHDDLVVVGFVIPGSAAAEAGLAEGDEVVSIAGRPAIGYTPDELTELFEKQPAGTRVALEFSRKGSARKVQMKLKDLL